MFNVTGGQSIDINRTVPDSRLLLRAFLMEKCIKALPEPKIERWTSFSTDTLALTPPITQSTAWVLRQTAPYNLGDRLQTGFTIQRWLLRSCSQKVGSKGFISISPQFTQSKKVPCINLLVVFKGFTNIQHLMWAGSTHSTRASLGFI